MVAGKTCARRLVFVDEMGANVSLSPLYAWSRRRASQRFGPAQLGQEHDLAGEHLLPRDGAVSGGRGRHDEGGLRGLPRARPGADPVR